MEEPILNSEEQYIEVLLDIFQCVSDIQQILFFIAGLLIASIFWMVFKHVI